MKLQFLSAGRLRLKKSVYVKTADRSETFEAPVSSALIRHKQGNVLFDTGCHPSVVEHGEERWGSLMKVMTPVMRAEDTLLPSLACVGVNPDDIDVVVNSHFHPDHCGCNAVLQEGHHHGACQGDRGRERAGAEAAGYLRADWDHGQPTDAVNGEQGRVRRRQAGSDSIAGSHARVRWERPSISIGMVRFFWRRTR